MKKYIFLIIPIILFAKISFAAVFPTSLTQEQVFNSNGADFSLTADIVGQDTAIWNTPDESSVFQLGLPGFYSIAGELNFSTSTDIATGIYPSYLFNSTSLDGADQCATDLAQGNVPVSVISGECNSTDISNYSISFNQVIVTSNPSCSLDNSSQTSTVKSSIDCINNTTGGYFSTLLTHYWPFLVGGGVLLGVWHYGAAIITSFL